METLHLGIDRSRPPPYRRKKKYIVPLLVRPRTLTGPPALALPDIRRIVPPQGCLRAPPCSFARTRLLSAAIPDTHRAPPRARSQHGEGAAVRERKLHHTGPPLSSARRCDLHPIRCHEYLNLAILPIRLPAVDLCCHVTSIPRTRILATTSAEFSMSHVDG